MRERSRRRGLPGGVGRAAPRPRRVGEPNVLSDASTPNVLSTQAGRPQPLVIRPVQGDTTARAAAPVPQANRGWLATGQAVPAPRIRLPSFGTLLFVGFVAITAFRLLGEFTSGIASPTSEPIATTPAAPGSSTTPGRVTFGTGQGSACRVLGEADEFGPDANVWWSAELSTTQPADAAAVVVVRRNGAEVDRQLVAPDTSSGEWSVLCAGEPIRLHDPGTYRVEVWSKDESVLHAVGEYRVRAS